MIKSIHGKYYISKDNTIRQLKFFEPDSIDIIILLKENSNNHKEIYAYTILHMYKYGIDNVRGGGITSKFLSNITKLKYQEYFKKLNNSSTLENTLSIL